MAELEYFGCLSGLLVFADFHDLIAFGDNQNVISQMFCVLPPIFHSVLWFLLKANGVLAAKVHGKDASLEEAESYDCFGEITQDYLQGFEPM